MKRNSNIELLRIISMIMIIISHYTVHNGITNATLPLGFNRFLLQTTKLGNIGVILFILITGYYGIKKDNPFNLKRLVLLILEVFFYSSLFYILFVIAGLAPLDWESALHFFLPISHKAYWFMTTYFVLYMFMPFINKLLNNITRKEHIYLMIIAVILFYVVYTITAHDFYGNHVIQFFTIYIIGAYLGKYEDNCLDNKRSLLLIVSNISMMIASVLLIDILGNNHYPLVYFAQFFFNTNSVFVLLFSIGFFKLFVNRKPKHNKFVLGLSKHMLGVYLIHEHDLIRFALWIDLLQIVNYVDKWYLFLHMMVSVIGVFVICVILDWTRYYTFEILASKVYDRIAGRFNKKIKEAK